ncbi:MAG: radical SAM protein [Roseburia sp.]|nr:radical SAM protein [Roseburia sp.]MCM1243133.1 radical SAM protein [Roseburia sp.]
MTKFKEIIIALDMYGCPNRCRHCWLGTTPNGNMDVSEMKSAAGQFKPFTDCLQIYDWYREPDYRDNYQELFALCNRLSDKPIEHFELISFWRLVRDEDYVRWLSSIGLQKAQLTIFGSKETTDFYIGRKGAYAEILEAMEILLKNKISPRIQTFVNKNNIGELQEIENLIKRLDLEKRCKSFGGDFSFFLHQGSCDGENENWYDVRVTPDDLLYIPKLLEDYTLRHCGKSDIREVFGKTEQALYDELAGEHSTAGYVSDRPVFYIDKDFNVYPNITSPAPYWCLGNLKKHGAERILENYMKSSSIAQQTRLTVPLCDIVKAQGDRTSQRLFSRDDYIVFLLNKYCRRRLGGGWNADKT